LKGFQRREIRTHANAIVEFLNSGPVLFPNAIILALAPDIEFKNARSSRPEGMVDVADIGMLVIPIRPEGNRVAWIVDGQQRSLALARAKNPEIPVPVVAFVSEELETHREQFILVNKAKPLPTRLINELLPEVSMLLPRDLSARRLPSVLCNALNRDPSSPFHKLIRRASDEASSEAVIVDTAVVKAIERNLKLPFGALSQYRLTVRAATPMPCTQPSSSTGPRCEPRSPEPGGKPPSASRLMHSVGIQAMGGSWIRS
jgi:DGQHR domain-containing protein